MLIQKNDNENVEQFIKEYEEKYNFEFPEEYKRFLKKYNGGWIEDGDFEINDIEGDIQEFYGFKKDKSRSCNYLSLDSLIIKDFLEMGVVVIGKTFFGDYILMGLGKKRKKKGKIYYMYHDEDNTLIPLTNTLKEFIAQCVSEDKNDDEDVEHLEYLKEFEEIDEY